LAAPIQGPEPKRLERPQLERPRENTTEARRERPREQVEERGSEARGKRDLWGLLGDVAYYLALVAFVVGVFLFRGAGGGAPVRVMGFSAMRVLTGSMGEVLPQGSLIITRAVDPNKLEVGDDITYMASEETTVTHRIVGITEDYMETGERAFTTQGTENASPDGAPVPAQNVVGKVIFHSLVLGKIFGFLRAQWPWVLALTALGAGLIAALRVLVQEEKKERAGEPVPERPDGPAS